MGFLPIVLTFTLFIFLWGLVNYNSFVAKRTRIKALAEAREKYAVDAEALLQEMVRQIEFHSVAVPKELLSSATGASGVPEGNGLALTEKLRAFITSHSVLQQDEVLQSLLQQATDNSAQRFRSERSLQGAVNDYNRYRQKMPYRFIAVLFGFKPILTGTY